MSVDPVLTLGISTGLHYLIETCIISPNFKFRIAALPAILSLSESLSLGFPSQALTLSLFHSLSHALAFLPAFSLSYSRFLTRSLTCSLAPLLSHALALLPVLAHSLTLSGIRSYGVGGFEDSPALCHEEQKVDVGVYGRVDGGAERICRESVQVSQARNTTGFCIIGIMYGHSNFLFW